MQNIFKNKRMKIVEKTYVVELKVANPLIHLWWMSTWPSPKARLVKMSQPHFGQVWG
jgi:hypothetical protein